MEIGLHGKDERQGLGEALMNRTDDGYEGYDLVPIRMDISAADLRWPMSEFSCMDRFRMAYRTT
jgi:hypothetical protein